jgi:microcystin-dependent protein
MSDTTSGLILFIRFDEVENGKVVDESGNDYDGTLQGAPALVPDDMFGSCLHFTRNGDYVALPALQADFTNGLTIEAWANYAAFEEWSRIIDFRNSAGTDGLVLANEETTANLVLEIFVNGALSTIKAAGALRTGQWLHLAATVEAKGNATLYVNGQAVQSGGQLALPSGATLSSNAIGKSNTDSDGYFRGKIASLRVYNRALAAEEIAKDMEADKAASASFRAVYPISFRLYDANDQATLYITDNPAGLPLNLELQDTSPYSIQLAAPATASASAANHHFQLRFRPGTLLDLARITLKESGWNLQAETTPNGDSLYLLCTAGRTLAVDEKIHLTLQHTRANGSGGAHGTRVELKYHQLNYAGDTVALTGSRVQHLSIVNHSGEIVIPLHASFKGSQLVLNDGTSANALTLLIYNTSTTETIPWNPGDFQSATSSKFIISFDEEGSKPKDYALAEAGQVETIEIKDNEGAGWECHRQTLGESTEWIVTHSTKTSIAVDEVIELAISSIITSLPSGLTNLYLRYQNIPGYWDGQLIRAIEKAPLQYVDMYVGIGTATPRTALDLGKGLMSGAANDYQKAQFTLSGGGTVTWGGPGARLKWTQRFIAISMERSKTFSEGHVEINQPTTDIPATQVYDGHDRSANAEGIVLNAWESLYAVHEVGGNKLAVSFQIVKYTTMDFFVPSNWILIAAVNMDDQTVKLGTGAIISANSSTAKGTGVPCGTIVMWYGDVHPVPDGWALCNGENGTPNLVDRFIVAAGNKYNPGDTGGTDSVKLSAGNLPGHQHSGTTSLAGSHYHQSKLDTGSGGDSQSLMPTGGNNYRNEWFSTESTGDHSHTVTVSSTNEAQPHENRPPYYAVYFIMKLF